MTTRIDISIGPVQGFVAQSRRTRDLWGSSYLLSFLSAHAMRGVKEAGGHITRPVVDDDHLYRWISGIRDGTPPRIGTLPNHFVVETSGDARRIARAGEAALKAAWRRVSNAVREHFVEHACPAGDGTERIWNRQVDGFWEVTWTAGPSDVSGLLARRKHCRSHRLPDEPGDKCTVMSDLQELSGHIRARSRESRERQECFWRLVRERLGPLDVRENERLCAIAVVKRLFPNPKVAQEALGWTVDASHWPSTVYVGAVPWVREAITVAPEPARRYADAALQCAPHGAFAEHRPPFDGLGNPAAGDFPKLDANYYHRNRVQDERLCPLASHAVDGVGVRGELTRLLKAVHEARNEAGHRLGPPCSFYALLLADGDRLGKLVANLGGQHVGRALATFTESVQTIVNTHDGVTIYAGGDDILAMLSVPGALSCAAALSCSYRSAFKDRRGEDTPGATLSAAVLFAHVRSPLGSVLATTRRLLDDVAKDGNGRDSLAVGVLKPGGLYCQWVTTWTRTTPDGERSSAIPLLNDLVDRLKSDASEPGLSSALVYRIRETISSLCGWDRWEPGAGGALPDALDIRAFLQAEILHSLTVRMEEGAETRAAEMTDLAWKLLRRSRAPSGDDDPGIGDGGNAEARDGDAEHAEAGVDALLLARFLASSGQEAADR